VIRPHLQENVDVLLRTWSTMARGSYRLASPLMLVFLLFLASMQPLFLPSSLDEDSNVHYSSQDPGVQDVPTWRVGDKWVYSGTFDPTKLVTDSGVQATVGEIYGDSTAEVTAITERNVDT